MRRLLLSVATLLVGGYGLGAFAMMDVNPAAWPIEVRGALAAMAGFGLLFAVIIRLVDTSFGSPSE